MKTARNIFGLLLGFSLGVALLLPVGVVEATDLGDTPTVRTPPDLGINAPDVESDCNVDLDDDGIVGFGDILGVIGAWGVCVTPDGLLGGVQSSPPDLGIDYCPADLDQSGDVGFGDLLIVIRYFGARCSDLPTGA